MIIARRDRNNVLPIVNITLTAGFFSNCHHSAINTQADRVIISSCNIIAVFCCPQCTFSYIDFSNLLHQRRQNKHRCRYTHRCVNGFFIYPASPVVFLSLTAPLLRRMLTPFLSSFSLHLLFQCRILRIADALPKVACNACLAVAFQRLIYLRGFVFISFLYGFVFIYFPYSLFFIYYFLYRFLIIYNIFSWTQIHGTRFPLIAHKCIPKRRSTLKAVFRFVRTGLIQ